MMSIRGDDIVASFISVSFIIVGKGKAMTSTGTEIKQGEGEKINRKERPWAKNKQRDGRAGVGNETREIHHK